MKNKQAPTGQRYDTDEKKIKFVKRKGSIVTFKKPFYWKGERFWQILVEGFEKQQRSVKIIGFTRDTPWYASMDDLLKAIDWNKLERCIAQNGIDTT